MKGVEILATLLLASEAATANQQLVSAVVQRLAADKKQTEASATTPKIQTPALDGLRESSRRNLRNLQEENAACDSAFLDCLRSDNCVDCFVELETKQIDWASVTKDTPCSDVTKFLFNKDHCKPLESDTPGRNTFCKTFDVCVDWEDGDDDKKKDDANRIKCSELTECKWGGMHEQFLGDGICHDKVDGCYNTEVCGWDGGDCCEDTCKTSEGSYVQCGQEGYLCKDPSSSKCDKTLNPMCKSNDDKKTKPPMPTCREGTTLYRLIMYDSFGDGWDGTKIEISDTDKRNEILYSLALSDGSQGTEYICLSKTPACYHIDVKGGVWGKEVSWEVKPLTEGAPSIGSGGSPMSCDFPVAGIKCDNTCTGRTDEDPTKDPDYKEFKEMSQCIADKCPIQIGACEADDVCVDCFKDIPADYCYADDFFNALLDCAICKCTDSSGSDFCNKKTSPGLPIDTGGDDDDYTRDPCSPAETVSGGNAVLAFGKCAEIDQASMMVTDFDQNNFGELDSFESCAHAWKSKPDRGGHSPLECLQILVDAKNGDFKNTPAGAPKDAIKALANHLYSDPEKFCECASKASVDCPLCPSFMNFKTLLYESLDACLSLDEIDCAAWTEFYPKCKENLTRDKGGVDFSKDDQCAYVRDGCSGAGPFPVFRRLDCDQEVSNEAWSFYTDYATKCMKDGPTPPAPAPAPTPPQTPAPVSPTTPAPAPTPSSDDYITPVSPTDKKPYIPPEERGKDKKKKESPADAGKPKKKSHFLRNLFWFLVIGGGVYYYYKNYGFDFSFLQRYRRFRPVSSYDGGEMYSGLTMESSTSFQPPTLPPTPIDMGGGASSNGGHFI